MSLLGMNEMVIIGAAIIALILGPKKLPELARSLGRSKQEYNKSMAEAKKATEELETDTESESESAAE